MTERNIVNAGFWRRRRVLITGHTGFKGGWLAIWLESMGARILGYALAPETTPCIFDAAAIGGLVDHLTGDVGDGDGLDTVVRDFSPEIIFHLAAQPLVRRSYRDPIGTYRTNVMGTANLFEACRHVAELKAVINVTSDKCYENDGAKSAFRESDRLGGHDPYSSSKACSELVTSAYRDSFFSPDRYDDHGVTVASARAGNVIGGGDWNEDRLIPDAARAFAAGKDLDVRMPDAVRPWQHVLEPLHGYLALAEACTIGGPAYGEGWNFGPRGDQVLTVREIVTKFKQSWKGKAEWRTENSPPSLAESDSLLLNSDKARERLHWSPRLTIDEAIDMTTEWYGAYYDRAPAAALLDLSRRQISRFLSRA